MVNSFVKTLAMVLGSEEEAIKKIYSVSTCTYTGFGALILEKFYIKLKAQPGALWVLPDSYLDISNTDYGDVTRESNTCHLFSTIIVDAVSHQN
ncbi:hypothetical protein G4B88_016164 [Cannabis sativa]|uniref:MORF/ORRM1/DAG-like MORF domain-containing protein n=1 Tax=Cannabis sativa TaxID=3483 RepID=A0A7J6FH34_CANSA|nr:hypothetical protein G4B88_016164 [Cannabis sativa]